MAIEVTEIPKPAVSLDLTIANRYYYSDKITANYKASDLDDITDEDLKHFGLVEYLGFIIFNFYMTPVQNMQNLEES